MEQNRQLLLKLGIRSTYKGFRYLCYGLELCLQDEDYLLAIYKSLYVDIANHFHTNRDNIEHCIRTVVHNCWNFGNQDFLMEISGNSLSGKPTNGEFIDILYNYLRIHENEPIY